MKHDGRYVIRMNDKTDHDGQVIEASSETVVMGLPAALEGDMTFCPRCKGNFAIKTDRTGARHAGKNYAYHGDVTECGARLLSSEHNAGAAPNSSGATGPANDSPSMSSETEREKFDDRFHLYDGLTGTPLIKKEYALRRADGRVEFGVTDDEGGTHLLTPHQGAEPIEIYV
jgi:uncharacterized Zn-binding protein involved in type VI secretion